MKFVTVCLGALIVTMILGPAHGDDQPSIQDRRFVDVISHVSRFVARVTVASGRKNTYREGTAFLVDKSQIYATCWHLMRPDTIYYLDTLFSGDGTDTTILDTFAVYDSSRVSLTLNNNGESYRARIVAVNTVHDIALLTLDWDSDQTMVFGDALALGHADEIAVGIEVGCTGFDLAQSYPNDKGGLTHVMTTHKGIISAVIPIDSSGGLPVLWFQLDMVVNRGASGAPVFDATTGRVLGMHKGVAKKAPGNTLGISGIANCTPTHVIEKLFTDTFSRTPRSH